MTEDQATQLLHFAFDRRQSNDYGEFSYVDQGEAEIALSDAKSGAVDNFLKSITVQFR